MRRLPYASVSLSAALLFLASCATSPRDEQNDVLWDIDHGRFEEAVTRIAVAREKNPDDPELEELHIIATAALYLDRGRLLTFEERDLEALDLFLEAQKLAPGSAQVEAWIKKTRKKLANNYLDAAFESESNGDLDAASHAYEQSLIHWPDNQNGVLGLSRVLVLKNYREGLGEEYYNDGVRALGDYWLEQASSRFSYAGKYLPKEERTAGRRAQVSQLLAAERVALAESLGAKELYSAARNEYRIALLVDPENAEASAGLEKMKLEAEAAEKLNIAKMFILRGRFLQAEKLLDEWEEKTSLQKESFRGVRDGIQEARFERLYDEAYVLERDFRYPEAVKVYAQLLEVAQWYKDVRARKDTLEEYIRRAEDLFARAEAEASDEERLRLYEELEIFWPEYQDLQQRLRDLRGEATPGVAPPLPDGKHEKR